MKKLIYALSLTLVCSSVSADISITQADKILGFTGYDGKQIQIQFEFQNPIENNESVVLSIDNKKILSVKNQSTKKLERFTTRLRFNKDESVAVNTVAKKTTTLTFTPTVSSNFELPNKDSFSSQARASVVSEAIAKSYGAKKGDCIFLFGGISNTGAKLPKLFTVTINGESMTIESSERLASNPFFIIGINEIASSCEIAVQ
jgi:hypothetical protein